MGAIAEGIVAYAKPLFDETDGSHQQMERALMLAHFCFNVSLAPKDERESSIANSQTIFEMDDEEFDAFRKLVVLPMIQRHEEMFPFMHRRLSDESLPGKSSPWAERLPPPAPRKKVAFDRYAPCPCESGKKYKFCCEKTAR